MTLEKELRTMSWLAVGQLVRVTIVKDVKDLEGKHQ